MAKQPLPVFFVASSQLPVSESFRLLHLLQKPSSISGSIASNRPRPTGY